MTNYPIQDVVVIIAKSIALAEQHKQQICLRGFETVDCYEWDASLSHRLASAKPSILLVDLEGMEAEGIELITEFGKSCAVLCFVPYFNEELFLTCHDAGIRDFMVKPVEQTYLVSRILQVMDLLQLQKQLNEQNVLLQSLSVLSQSSGVYTSDYFLRLFSEKLMASSHYWQNPASTSLLVVQLKASQMSDPAYEETIGTILKRCARGSDIIGEFGKDTYIIWLTNAGLDGARSLTERLRTTLQKHPVSQNATIRLISGMSDLNGCDQPEAFLNSALENLKQNAMA